MLHVVAAVLHVVACALVLFQSLAFGSRLAPYRDMNSGAARVVLPEERG